MIEHENVMHNSQDIYYRSNVGAAPTDSMIRLGIKLRTKEEVRQILLRMWRESFGEKVVVLKTDADCAAEERFYYADVKLPEIGCLIWYYFIIESASGTRYYGNNPEMLGGEGEIYDKEPPSFQITVYEKKSKTPDWFKKSIMYQIFPDRFYREGNEIIEKKGAVVHTSWKDAPCYYKDPDTKEIVAYDFFGGNLKGLMKKLSYLKELGISTIYLNPVFESESNHHYDTGDYHKIDPILGTNEEFHDFVEKAKDMGIHVILDGVFSHT